MAFNVNAQVVLSGPKNLNNVRKKVQTQLGQAGNIKVNVSGNATKTFSTLNQRVNTLNSGYQKFNSTQASVAAQARKTNAAIQAQTKLLGGLGKRFGTTVKQAFAFGLISRPVFELQRAITGAVKEAIKFERELVKISQVTGQSLSQLSNLQSVINDLSTSLGVNANELAETARIIAQTGRSAQETEVILKALAKSTLAPTFGKITETTEGLIAALGQFKLSAADSESILGSLNAVSKSFAVEAEDLISVVRRAGGVFSQAAGGTKGTITALQELSAIFTSVRSTTRESADTIAAGLRTIFSRIQRGQTIDFLKQFGVELTNAKGQFVGIFPAFDQLSQRLKTLIDQGDALALASIAEELGGIRQVGKLLPAIANFDKARKALEVAQKGAAEGLSGDVGKALDTLDVRLKKVQEEFGRLIRNVFESDSFQTFAKSLISTSSSLIKGLSGITEVLEPILPLLVGLGSVKLGSALGGLVGGGAAKGVGALTGATSAKANQQVARSSQQTNQAVNQLNQSINSQTQILSSSNKTLSQIYRQLTNLIRVVSSRPLGGPAPTGGRRKSGGFIPKFATGGKVYGPSHAAGGVIAELEGGEYVVPKKFAKGGLNEFPSSKPFIKTSGTTYTKEAGAIFDTGRNRFNQKDTLDFNRTEDLKLDVSKENRKSKLVQSYFNAPTPQQRGFAFEQIAKKKYNLNIAGGSSRIDASRAGGQLYEIKSEKEALSDKRLGEKIIGAAISPISDIDKNMQARLKKIPLTGKPENINLGRIGVIQDITKGLGRAAGGFIQKLATGDIVKANNVGVAILDPDDAPDGSAKVSVKDVEAQIGFSKDTKAGFSGVGKLFKGKTYGIIKQGLNKKTSDRFNQLLAEGLIKGVDFAASGISNDIGLGPTVIDQASKTKFIQSQRSAIRGDLFEAVLSSLNNRGKFDNAVDFARPFDFPNGLQGPFADNFSKLPSKFVDAKSSIAAAPDTNIRGKIIRELATDLIAQDPNILAQKNKQTGGKSSKKKPTQARGFGALTFANGGEVPVRISNGEMVVTNPKEVAANRGKLQSINKLATGGFASGTIARGPGTGTSDSIHTTLPEGAFVVNAKSTKKYLGLRRGGGVRRYATGTPGGGVSGGGAAQFGFSIVEKAFSDTARAASNTTKSLNPMNQSIVNSNKNLQSLRGSVYEIQQTAQAGAKALGLNQKATTQQTQTTVKNTQVTQKQVQNISALDRVTNFIIKPFNAIAKGANRADQAIDRAFNRTLSQNTRIVGNGLRQFGQRIKDNIASLAQFAGKLKTSLTGLRGASAAAAAGGIGGTPAVNKKIQAKLDKAAGKKGGGSRGVGGDALGGLVGAAFSLQFAFSSLQTAYEDGVLTFGELAQTALYVLPAFVGLVPVLKELGIAAKKLAADLAAGGAAGKAAFGKLASGVAIGVGALVLGLGEVFGKQGSGAKDVTRGVGAGLIAGGLAKQFGASGPLSIAIAGFTATIVATISYIDAGLKRLDAFPETLKRVTNAAEKLAKNIDKLDFAGAATAIQEFQNKANRLSAQGSLASEQRGSFSKAFTSAFNKVFLGSEDPATLARAADNLQKIAEQQQQFIGNFLGRAEFTGNEAVQQDLERARGFGLSEELEGLEGTARTAAETSIRFEALKSSLEKAAATAKTVEEQKAIEKIAKQLDQTLVQSVQASIGDVVRGFQNLKGIDKTAALNFIESIQSGNFTFKELQDRLAILANVAARAGEEGKELAAEILSLGQDAINGLTQNAIPDFSRQINQTTIEINNFASAVSNLTSRLAASTAEINGRISTALSDIENILSGSAEINIGASDLGRLFGEGSTAEERQQGIQRIGALTGQDVSGIAALDKTISGLQAFTEDFARKINEGSIEIEKGTTGLADTFAEELKAAIPDIPDTVLEQARNALLPGAEGREGTTADPVAKLEEFLASGNIAEAFGLDKFDLSGQLEELVKTLDARNAALEKIVSTEIKIQQSRNAVALKEVETRQKVADLTAKILGVERDSFAAAQANLQQRLAAVGVGTDDAGALARRRSAAIRRREALEDDVRTGKVSADAAAPEIKALTNEIQSNSEALKILSDRSQELAAVQEEATKAANRQRIAEGGLRELIKVASSGDPEAIQELNSQLFGLSRVFAGTASLPQAVAALDTLSSNLGQGLANAAFGPGAADTLTTNLTRQLGTVLAGGGGLIGGAAGALLESSVKEQNKQVILAGEANLIAQQQLEAQRQLQKQNEELINEIKTSRVDDPLKESTRIFNESVKQFNEAVKNLNKPPEDGAIVPAFATGGVVHRSRGGTDRKAALAAAFTQTFSKGTDTQAAMLTPGEFVMRKEAVDSQGAGAMAALNAGKAKIVQASTGGRIGSGVLYRRLGGFGDDKPRSGDRGAIIPFAIPAPEYYDTPEEATAAGKQFGLSGIHQDANGKFGPGKSAGVYEEGSRSAREAAAAETREVARKEQVDRKREAESKRKAEEAKANDREAIRLEIKFLQAGLEKVGVNVDDKTLFSGNFDLSQFLGAFTQDQKALSEAIDLISRTTNQELFSSLKKNKETGLYEAFRSDGDKGKLDLDDTLNTLSQQVLSLGKASIATIQDKSTQATENRFAAAKQDLANAQDAQNKVANLKGKFPEIFGDKEAFLTKIADEYAQQFLKEDKQILEDIQYGKKRFGTPRDLAVAGVTKFSEEESAFRKQVLGGIVAYSAEIRQALQNAGGEQGGTFAKPILAAGNVNPRNSLITSSGSGDPRALAYIANKDQFTQAQGLANTVEEKKANLEAARTTGALGVIAEGEQLKAEEKRKKDEAARQAEEERKRKAAEEEAKKQQEQQAADERRKNFDAERQRRLDRLTSTGAITEAEAYKAFALEAFIKSNGANIDAVNLPWDITTKARGGTPEDIATALGEAAQQLKPFAGKLRQARTIANGLESDPTSDEYRKALEKKNQLLGTSPLSPAEQGRQDRANQYQQQQDAKRATYEKQQQARRNAERRRQGLPPEVGTTADGSVDRKPTDEELQFQSTYNSLVAAGLASVQRGNPNANLFLEAQRTLDAFRGLNTLNKDFILDQIAKAKTNLFGDPNATFPPQLQRFHTGGMVRGYNKGGEVPIMAQDGEFVMSRNAVRRNGLAAMHAMNGGIVDTFHTGGLVQRRQRGGSIFGGGRGNTGPASAMSVDASQASELLKTSIIDGGTQVTAQWKTLFEGVAQQLNSSLSSIAGIPEKINTEVAPVEILGTDSISNAIATAVIPKIVDEIKKMIGGNNEGIPPATPGAGV